MNTTPTTGSTQDDDIAGDDLPAREVSDTLRAAVLSGRPPTGRRSSTRR
jgi:hypothetical protein